MLKFRLGPQLTPAFSQRRKHHFEFQSSRIQEGETSLKAPQAAAIAKAVGAKLDPVGGVDAEGHARLARCQCGSEIANPVLRLP